MLKTVYMKLWNAVRYKKFSAAFSHLGQHSGFGRNGWGDDCSLCGCNMIFVGDNSWFGRNTVIRVISTDSHQGRLHIGNNARSTERLEIICAGEIYIGNNVLIAPEVFITDTNHGMDPTFDGYGDQPYTVKSVVVEDGVWLGQRSMVMPGTRIGEHSIIGAGSIVTHDIPAYSIAVGAPARVVKQWDSISQSWRRIKSNE